MKFQTTYKLLFAMILTILVSISCDDTIKQVGFTIQPGQDGISVGTDTLTVQATTVQVDKIFAKTKNPVLGEYIDPLYGTIKSDYVGEFYFPEGETFPSGSKIDSVQLAISYLTWVGDSLAPMRISAYEITEAIDTLKYYTDVNISGHYSTTPIGEGVYSVNSSEHNYYGSTIRYIMSIKLPDTLGQRFLNNPDKLKDTETFKQFFKGLYVTTTFGSGTIFDVEYTRMLVHYSYTGRNKENTKDSVYTDYIGLSMTPEVKQINRIQNNNTQLLAPNPDYTFIKSPAGVNTRVVFPFSQISDKLKSQALNLAKFTVQAMPDNSDEKFKLSPPARVLLINEDSLSGFFESRRLANNITNFIAALDTTTYQYNFPNLSSMINHYKEKNNGTLTDLNYLLIPISATTSTSSDYYGRQTTTISTISNMMMPSAVTISKKPEDMKLELVFSKF